MYEDDVVGNVSSGCCRMYVELGVEKSGVRDTIPKRNHGNGAQASRFLMGGPLRGL